MRKYILWLSHVGKKKHTLRCTYGGDKPHTDLLMVLRNLTLRHTHGGDKPYIEACTCIREVTKGFVETNLTLRFVHGVEKTYTEIYSWWWQTLHWDLLMALTNLTLRLDYVGLETLPWDILMVVTNHTLRYTYGGDKLAYAEINFWWREPLHWGILMVMTNLTRHFAHGGDKHTTGFAAFDFLACFHSDAFS